MASSPVKVISNKISSPKVINPAASKAAIVPVETALAANAAEEPAINSSPKANSPVSAS
jgi:hypothetical protein